MGRTRKQQIEELRLLVEQVEVKLQEYKKQGKLQEMESLYAEYMEAKSILQKAKERKREVVFLPYKASMWDSLESVWKATEEDPDCNAYVIPIPYYEKNPDGSFKEMQYEGELYPAYVPITHYETYDFEERKPDMIFIHNPYDEYNLVTSVHPFFYSKHLKQFTENLIYIPYFIRDEISIEDTEEVERMAHFCTVPAVFHADKVIVQSEEMKQIYIKVLMEQTNRKNQQYWEQKILGLGSPKIDKLRNTRVEDLQIPKEWEKLIIKSDGSRKKVVLYNTHLILVMLPYGKKYLLLLKETLDMFKRYTDIVLLWRPHPLTISTIKSMNPNLLEDYMKIVEEYKKQQWGIYDESSDLNRAITISDAYFGSIGSVWSLYKYTRKPMLIQDYDILWE
ncbi:MAG: CDP-glycerol glycerophosphotransferase family protein [Lachnospiraceae bacterium]|nr:CDP-glycerol glycerophosphotransferase family protein [Lachnospiraceae bacterium]